MLNKINRVKKGKVSDFGLFVGLPEQLIFYIKMDELKLMEYV